MRNAGRDSMRIVGEWLLCDDEVTRPAIRAQVLGADGMTASEYFLVDTGADRTVFRAALVTTLRLPVVSPRDELTLVGVGGSALFVTVAAVLELPRDNGGLARIRGEFAAFTDHTATDLSVLGRDVMDNFDVIVSRRRDDVAFLATNHRYQVAQT